MYLPAPSFTILTRYWCMASRSRGIRSHTFDLAVLRALRFDCSSLSSPSMSGLMSSCLRMSDLSAFNRLSI